MSDETEAPIIRSFSSGSVFADIENVRSTAYVLREVAMWIEQNDYCLINISSVGFGEPDEIVLQVVVTEMASGTDKESQP